MVGHSVTPSFVGHNWTFSNFDLHIQLFQVFHFLFQIHHPRRPWNYIPNDKNQYFCCCFPIGQNSETSKVRLHPFLYSQCNWRINYTYAIIFLIMLWSCYVYFYGTGYICFLGNFLILMTLISKILSYNIWDNFINKNSIFLMQKI